MNPRINDANEPHDFYTDRISSIVSRFPKLTMFGFEDPKSDTFGINRQGLMKGENDFYTARGWLAPLLGCRRVAPDRGCGSYFLKQQYEISQGRYIPNGFFIAVAIDFRFRIREDGINASIGVRFPANRRPYSCLWTRRVLPDHPTPRVIGRPNRLQLDHLKFRVDRVVAPDNSVDASSASFWSG
jgi:hypothetical protein